MVPLLLCSGLLLAPALASRVNRQQPQDQAIGDTRLRADADPDADADADDAARPEGERASRSAPRPAVAPALPASTLVPPLPTTSAPSTTTTSHHHHPAAKVAAVAKAAVPTSTTKPPRTTTTTTKAPAPTTTTTAAPAYQNGQAGKASWYAAAAPGECAHRTIAKGTMVVVTNTANKRTVKCRVSDRGPYVDGRIIDLSQTDFEQLAGSHEGVIDVFVQW